MSASEIVLGTFLLVAVLLVIVWIVFSVFHFFDNNPPEPRE